MDYSGNLLSETWTTVGVTTEAEYFKLVDNASMHQEVPSLLFVLEPRDFKVKADFYFSTTPSIINAKIRLTLKYYDGNNDKFIIPLVPIGTAALGWYSVEETCNVHTESVLLSVEFEVLVTDVANDFRIRSIELRRSVTPLEMHEINTNPHQLPLAITVSQEGIKATKGEIIKFWLKDTGDAEFAGELKSATGTFLGSVVVGEDTTFDEGYDPSEAISQVEGWTYTGTTKIDGGQIYTGTILAAAIKAGELIVGSNVGLGTAVDEDGVVSIIDGTITADYINALGVGALKIYKLGYPNNYMTIGGTYADLELYYNSNKIFAIENTPGSGAYLRAAGASGVLSTFLSTTGGFSSPMGEWDFQSCTVVNLGVTATFG